MDAAFAETMLKTSGGVVVTHGAESTWGHEDTATELVHGEGGRPGISGTARSVLVPTGALSAGKGDRIVVDGVNRIVREPPMREDDGIYTRFWVSDGR